MYANSIDALIGNTPLLDISSIAGRETGTRILGKYEAANPGGSIKDRIAKAMIDAAEASGLIEGGGRIIEATSGNTGIGLAMLAAARGYGLTLVMPETRPSQNAIVLHSSRRGQTPKSSSRHATGAQLPSAARSTSPAVISAGERVST